MICNACDRYRGMMWILLMGVSDHKPLPCVSLKGKDKTTYFDIKFGAAEMSVVDITKLSQIKYNINNMQYNIIKSSNSFWEL